MSARNDWLFSMKAFARQQGSERRHIHPRELSIQQYAQYRIHGGAIVNWLQRHGPALLAEREVLKHLCWWDGDPFVVVLSDLPGLVATEQIVPPAEQHVCGLTMDEYCEFLSQHPDHDYRWHVTYQTIFETVSDPQLLVKAQHRYPLPPKAEYWLHKEESVLGELFTRTGFHLWKWDGNDYGLLEEAFMRHIS